MCISTDRHKHFDRASGAGNNIVGYVTQNGGGGDHRDSSWGGFGCRRGSWLGLSRGRV